MQWSGPNTFLLLLLRKTDENEKMENKRKGGQGLGPTCQWDACSNRLPSQSIGLWA